MTTEIDDEGPKTALEMGIVKGKRLDKVQEQIVQKRLLALAMQGCNVNQMMKLTGLSHFIIARIIDKPEFKSLVEETTDKEIMPILSRARQELSGLVFEAVRVLKHHLDNNSLDAAKTVFKTIGLENQEPERKDAAINIIMPGSAPPAEKYVENDLNITLEDEI